ncbi:CsbD family protein [Streptomyces sp. IB2014 016-6]|uniref:CsbD family protein n=1 Tax=Streptomyces sp. IB2014 016-6 TaxID=2517818 RepID=UPI0011CCABBF|nr:CsbD family protein [Streptomyces sp. IB2014 016-6]TXL86608.1 CsbD family protein [Streptomyces sp. IB2014 016-6]
MSDDNATDKLKGKAKEMTGKATGDKSKETEGKTDQVKAAAEKKAADMKDRVDGAKESFKREDDS